MKKTMIVLVFAIIAGTLFAQELKFDGYVNSGLGLVITGQEDMDPYITAFGVDSEQYGYRFRLNGAYTNADGNAGAKFRFQAQSKNRFDTTMEVGLPIAMGWVKFADMITLNGGIIDDSTWASGGAILDDDMGEGLGFLLKLSPLSGLDLGAAAYAVSSLGSGDNNALAVKIDKNQVDWYEAKYVFNIGYTSPDLFKFTATFRTENNAGGDEKNRDESMKSIIGARILAVKNLTAIVEAELDELQDFETDGVTNFYETIGYKLDSLGFGLNAAQYLLQADNSDMGLRFNPWISYTIGNIVPRLDVVYYLGGQMDGNGGTSEGKYGRKTSYKASKGNDNDVSVIGVRPSVKINLDSKTVLEIGDLVNFEKAASKIYGTPGSDMEDSRIANVFYIDLKVSF